MASSVTWDQLLSYTWDQVGRGTWDAPLSGVIQPATVSLLATPTLSVSGKIPTIRTTLIAFPTLVVHGNISTKITLNLTITPTLFIQPKISPKLPDRPFTRYPYPQLIEPVRLIAQEILTGKMVDWDLPVQNDFSYTVQLSGPTTMSGAFLPEIISVQELGLDGYAYFLHVEISGEVRATGIFLPPQYQDSGFTFTTEGFSSISYYVTWGGQISEVGIDPLEVVRRIWIDVQNNPRSNLGIIISNTTSNKKLGTPAYTEIVKTLQESGVITTSMNEVVAVPYELLWWNSPNCGETLNNLATETPFDYRERVKWNPTKTGVELYVDYGYPRVGVPRDKLLFNEENVLEIVPIQETDDSYASEVLVIGAGEGSASIRGYAAENFGNRVRKMQVITDKTITTVQRANSVAVAELGLRKGSTFSLDEMVVHARHENASIGEYDVGDDIFVQVEIPWLIETHRTWYRIISITYQPSQEIVRLKVARSDSFQYPTIPTPSTPSAPDDALAAQAIMDRMLSGEDISEDWTWSGCPSYVSLYNDVLLGQFIGTGVQRSADDIAWTYFEEMAYEMTSTAENSRLDWYHTDVYGYIEDIDDDRGYTGGIVGFTTGTGDMLEVVQRYALTKPTNNQLKPYLDELQILANEGEGPNAGKRANALLGTPFKNLWASLAVSDILFRYAQLHLKWTMYWNPAYAAAVADKVRGLGLAILYDISVNHGPGNDPESFGGIVNAARKAAKPPSQGGSESAYITQLINKREQILISWGANQPDGRVTMHRAIQATGNYTLTTPFSWSIYGDNFTLSSRPQLPPEARRTGDIQVGTSSSGHVYSWPESMPDAIVWLQAYILERV